MEFQNFEWAYFKFFVFYSKHISCVRGIHDFWKKTRQQKKIEKYKFNHLNQIICVYRSILIISMFHFIKLIHYKDTFYQIRETNEWNNFFTNLQISEKEIRRIYGQFLWSIHYKYRISHLKNAVNKNERRKARMQKYFLLHLQIFSGLCNNRLLCFWVVKTKAKAR